VDARGGTPTSLTNSSHDTSDPAWSPDGSRIAFTDNDFGDILVAPSGGGEPVNLTADLRRSEESFAQPAWSPDGSRIAMSVFGGIFTMASNGTDLQQVNPAGTGGSQPSWR
jgi:Tol biopolymer transport system component